MVPGLRSFYEACLNNDYGAVLIASSVTVLAIYERKTSIPAATVMSAMTVAGIRGRGTLDDSGSGKKLAAVANSG